MSIQTVAAQLHAKDLAEKPRINITEDWVAMWRGRGWIPRIKWYGPLPFAEMYAPELDCCVGRWGVTIREALIVELMNEVAA